MVTLLDFELKGNLLCDFKNSFRKPYLLVWLVLFLFFFLLFICMFLSGRGGGGVRFCSVIFR